MSALRILYVDDDRDIRTIVSMSLSLDPAIVLTLAASGGEALDLVAKGPVPDVAILDVMMPGMDGPTLLDRLHAVDDTRDLPVIFMTARARAGDLACYRAQGAIGAILKPFDPMSLAAEIRGLLRAPHDPG